MPIKRNGLLRGDGSAERHPQRGTSSAVFRGQDTLREILDGNRDAVIVAGGSAPAYELYLPALFRRGSGKNAGKTLIIVPSAEIAAKIGDHARGLARKFSGSPSVLTVGIEENPRKETRHLSNPKDILVGTPERIIDHLRRGNTDLSETSLVVIDCPGESDMPGFAANVRFIYSRTGFRPRTLVLTAAAESGVRELKTVLGRPRTVELCRAEPRFRYYVAEPGGKTDLLLRILLAGAGGGWLVIREAGDSGDFRERLRSFFPASALAAGPHPAPEGIQVADPAVLGSALPAAGHVVFDFVPPPEILARMRLLYQDCDFQADIVIIIEERERSALSNAQESTDVSMEKNEIPKDDEAVRGLLENIVRKIKEEEDPRELNYYRKLFTGNVSIFLRSYVAAYLIKQQFGDSGEKRRPRPAAKGPSRPDMTTLFFGLGKNRKIFPRDISSLVTEKVPDVDRSDIGEIKILDNYSFVEISGAKADRVIETLNGTDYRGRKIVVNFARKKDGATE